MKTIIAGGRNYRLTEDDYIFLDSIPITEVVSGGCRGVDTDGENYAKLRDITIKIFPADWTKHGKSAGPIRNREMAQYADAVFLFPGGAGTKSMHREALKEGIKIYTKEQR